jgi:hypothetical protein
VNIPTAAPGTTAVSPTTAPPAPTQTVLSFDRDFESNTSGFAFEKGQWNPAKDKGNGVLEGNAAGLTDDVAAAVFGPADFSDGLIEFQVLFKNIDFGGLYLNFRDNFNEAYVLYLSPFDQQIVVGYNGQPVDWHLQPFSDRSVQSFSFAQDTWYTVQLEVLGNSFTVWVDENRLFTTNDERFNQGRLLFAIDEGGNVLIDNVKVWEYVK